jgi:hypothetical protein
VSIEKHKTGAFVRGRRAFLAGAGGTILALPFLESIHGEARAAPGMPRRFIVWHQGQGTQYDQLVRAGSSETDFTLGPILEPLAAHRERLTVVVGADNKCGDRSDGNGHTSAQVSCLCGQRNSGGPSIDQVVWERLRMAGQRTPLHLAVGETSRQGRFLEAASTPVESNGDPRGVWDSAFAGLATDEDATRRRRRRLRSLDAVRESFASLRTRLPSSDRDRLDRHASYLDEIETRLRSVTSCEQPLQPAMYSLSDWERQARDMFDLTVAAFTCNLTPVVTIEHTQDHDPAIFSGYLGPYSNWHEMVHSGESMRGIPGLRDGYRWYAERFAELLDRLAVTPEPDMPGSSMLDHTLILWTCDFGYGAGHNKLAVQCVLAGSLGAGVPMGRLLRFSDPEMLWSSSPWATNNVFTSILHAFGQTDRHFGHEGDLGDGSMIQPGPLPGLLG